MQMAQIEDDIKAAVSQLARRINIYHTAKAISVFMLWGSAIAVILAVIGKFVPFSIPVVFAVVLILCISMLAGLVRGMLGRVSAFDAARTADSRLGYKERISSAMEIMKAESRREMAQLQLEDAADFARAMDQKAICPRILPITAKILPLALAGLFVLIYVLSPYGQADQVPADVRAAIRQSGAEIESSIRQIAEEEEPLSEKAEQLALKMEAVGQEMKENPLTKREALRNLSNLAREAEALKMMAEMAQEAEGEVTPEKKRAINDLLNRLAENLRDMPEFSEFARKIEKAQQADLSEEMIQELADALRQMEIKASDIKTLQEMSDQIAKGKRDIGQNILKMARRPKETGGSDASDIPAEEESGLMGSGTPGKKTAAEMKEIIKSDSQRPFPSDQGDDLELEGQLSEDGRIITTETESTPEVGEAEVSYEEIYAEYRQSADDAISRQEIPWAYREHVRNYFDAIKPAGDSGN